MADPKRIALVELTISRFREFWREPGAVFWAFGFPLALALGLGLAFREQDRPLPRVATGEVVDPWLTETLESLDAAGAVVLVSVPAGELARALRTGAVDIAVSRAGGAAEVGSGLAYRFDPDRDMARTARLTLDDLLQRAAGREDRLGAIDLPADSRTRYIDFLFPGILGMTLMSSSIWGIGYTLALMRRRKLLKRLAATPMRRSDFLLSMFLSRALFLFVETIALLVFAHFVFAIDVEGSLAAFFLLALLGAASFAGIALLVAARVESVEAANGWLNFATMPMWLLSGLFFSYERFPELLHLPIRLLPLTALNDGLRAIANEGRGLMSLPFEIAVLVAWAIVTFVLALRLFRWQ
jgi:ABC-type multidrug transport system permease subunit